MIHPGKWALPALAACGVLVPPEVWADVVCPDSSYVEVDYACTFTGAYRTGEPLDTITVSPDGSGDSFADNGITIRVYLRNCQGAPVVGVPAGSITLTSRFICSCPGGNIADGPTDELGRTTFSGTLRAGGCVSNLVLLVDGVEICPVPVQTNSPNVATSHPCFVTTAEMILLAGQVATGGYYACFDFNEDGRLDITDFAMMTSLYLFANCQSEPTPPTQREVQR